MSEKILHLPKGGLPDAAFACWSSLYELAVTASFIAFCGAAWAEAYLDHEIVDELKCHQLDQELQAARGVKPHSDGCMKDLERDFQEMLEAPAVTLDRGRGGEGFIIERHRRLDAIIPLPEVETSLFFADLYERIEFAP